MTNQNCEAGASPGGIPEETFAAGVSLWGTGRDGVVLAQLFHLAGIPVSFFVDDARQGETLHGLPVLSRKDAMASAYTQHRLLCAKKPGADVAFLAVQGLTPGKDYTVYADIAVKAEMYRWFFEKLMDARFIENPPLFRRLEIETINRCNGSCSFCPANCQVDTRPYHKMDDALFGRIIAQLAELDYSGMLSLYSNNEPFLDGDILPRLRLAKQKLPKATHVLYTNGLLLTVERLLQALPQLDLLVIDNYSDGVTLLPPVAKISDYLQENPALAGKVQINMRLQDEVLTTRGGQAPNKQAYQAGCTPCVLPLYYAVIRPDGKFSLCCNDPLGKYTLGDVKTQRIEEIWQSAAFQKVRKTLASEGRQAMAGCCECDVYHPDHILRMFASGLEESRIETV